MAYPGFSVGFSGGLPTDEDYATHHVRRGDWMGQVEWTPYPFTDEDRTTIAHWGLDRVHELEDKEMYQYDAMNQTVQEINQKLKRDWERCCRGEREPGQSSGPSNNPDTSHHGIANHVSSSTSQAGAPQPTAEGLLAQWEPGRVVELRREGYSEADARAKAERERDTQLWSVRRLAELRSQGYTDAQAYAQSDTEMSRRIQEEVRSQEPSMPAAASHTKYNTQGAHRTPAASSFNPQGADEDDEFSSDVKETFYQEWKALKDQGLSGEQAMASLTAQILRNAEQGQQYSRTQQRGNAGYGQARSYQNASSARRPRDPSRPRRSGSPYRS